MNKVLSGRQPYWWAIFHATPPKRIENRTHNIVGAYRGPVLLHASCTQFAGAATWIETTFGIAVPRFKDLPVGGIVGQAVIADCLRPHTPEPIAVAKAARYGVDLRWWIRDQFGYILIDAEETPFRPAKGQLGLWTLSP